MSVYDKLVVLYANKHIEYNRNYVVLRSTVAVMLMSDMYESALRNNEIYGLQNLDEQTLEKYEGIAESIADERKPKEKIMKACYILDYITS